MRLLGLLAALSLLAAAGLAAAGPDAPAVNETTAAPTAAPAPPATAAPAPPATAAPAPPATDPPAPPATDPPVTPATDPPVAPVSTPTAAPSGTVVVNFKFVNDLRYHLYPVSATGSDNCPSASAGSCVGGLACLAKVAAPAADTVWLHSGVAMGYGEDKGLDAYSLLKTTTAAEALKLLDFKALSVDADMFRFGADGAKETATAVGATNKLACANCGALLADVKKYQAVDVTACTVAIIGVISKSRADKMGLAGVTEEVASIKDAVVAAKTDLKDKHVLFVVIGEATEATAKNILEQVDDVGVVLYSGNNIEDKDGFKLTKTDKGKVYATLAPALTKEAMRVATLKVTLDANYKPTDAAVSVQPYGDQTQDACLVGVADATKASLTTLTGTVLKAFEEASKAKGTSVLAMSSEPCRFVSCALGQLVADGVRAAANKDVEAAGWEKAARAVLIPADRFTGTLAAAPISAVDVAALFKDEGSVCAVSLSGQHLYGALESLLASEFTFPQLSGMWVDFRPEDGERAAVVWLQSADLTMWPVARDDAKHSVLMPCSAVSQLGLPADASNKTAVTLQDGLLWHLPTADAKAVLVPPVVEPRARLYVGIPSNADLCEDWTGMSVAYTLLVLGAVAMVGYQGYQFWRFRSTLSYIR